ncbi:propionyl-CoA synthetase [Sinimarinibacterium sp. CAU 1509]|uniref:propionyl-CoA synthetase n=1 Tax=Sinimarinibacterium sp. CAU 1509 TaxID=2562283 RepID=UPI0010ABF628|nr:propionyl-CoA synthetase [Sinimarinibacterium sp. CAU 1509]TJY64898.1 propionyl-CoA synthetase [Sinimarinibacterium sp. CAU 1509]
MADSPYLNEYRRSQREPAAFWAEQAEALHWDRRWDTVLDDSNAPMYCWFAGAQFNTCYNALDRHVEGGRADQLALIYDSPLTGSKQTFTYRELRDRVAHFAGALKAQGVQKGERVVIYMPMVPEAAIAMLACARIGAIHSVVFGGFAAPELAKRVDDAKPVLVVTASCGIEPGRQINYKPLLDQALELAAHKVRACIILQRPQCQASLVEGRDFDWRALEAAAEPAACETVAATDPLYVLYTSGTTGKPKGVVRDHGGHAVALSYSMQAVYNVKPGDVFWAASDVGWVVGHSYIVYGPLLYGCTTILYEGKPVGTPDAGAFWRVISEYKVKAFFTAPTAFRAIKKEDPNGELLKRYDISCLQTLFLAGERSDPDTIQWAQAMLKVPVVDHWWQTELGWPAIANCQGIEPMPVKPGSSSVPVPGFDLQVLDADGAVMQRDEIGNLAIKLPLPPGALLTMWNNEAGYKENYLDRYPGYYLTGDAGYIDKDGYVWIMSRIDDIINVAGHRLSTGAMEEVLAGHPDVAECAVVGAADDMKGQLPVGLVVLKTGVTRPEHEIVKELIARVRAQIGAVAAFKEAYVVQRLPKTRSGKVLRATMRAIADHRDYAVPATIDDPRILEEIETALKSRNTAT